MRNLCRSRARRLFGAAPLVVSLLVSGGSAVMAAEPGCRLELNEAQSQPTATIVAIFAGDREARGRYRLKVESKGRGRSVAMQSGRFQTDARGEARLSTVQVNAGNIVEADLTVDWNGRSFRCRLTERQIRT